MRDITYYGKFSIFQHVNNPGHWLENYEIWAAPGHQTRVASENGYVREPWKRISYEKINSIYLVKEFPSSNDTRRKVDAWLKKAFPA